MPKATCLLFVSIVKTIEILIQDFMNKFNIACFLHST